MTRGEAPRESGRPFGDEPAHFRSTSRPRAVAGPGRAASRAPNASAA